MTQSVTPALRSWIVEQTEAGFSQDAVMASMLAAGWEHDLAAVALEDSRRDHPPGQKTSNAQPTAPITKREEVGSGRQNTHPRLPDLALEQSPRVLDGGDDHPVEVLASLSSPRVVVLGGLLSAEECDGLIAAARPRLARSLTVQTHTGGEELNPDRTSNGMFFRRGESELIQRIEARIARLLHWPVEHGEGLQVLHYGVGAEYKPHYDYFDPAEPGTHTILKRGGQRLATLIMYLNEPEQGGGTIFPDVGLEVAPQRGNAVFFSYDRPNPATRTLHGGAPVISGEKWVATKWLRERVFE